MGSRARMLDVGQTTSSQSYGGFYSSGGPGGGGRGRGPGSRGGSETRKSGSFNQGLPSINRRGGGVSRGGGQPLTRTAPAANPTAGYNHDGPSVYADSRRQGAGGSRRASRGGMDQSNQYGGQ